VICPACQRANPEGSNFCNACGAKLARGAGDRPAAPARDPRDYTPAHLANRILATRGAVIGERKQVTVLFVDLESSVELSAGLDPEDWHRIMNHFLELLARGIHRFEGTINQYTGDGAMALFGAPLAHEDHAQRACHAALHIAEVTRRYAQELRRERSLDFNVRMGLNSGDVVVGRIGDDLRMDYTAQGAVVGLAARMQQICEPGRVYLTEHTAKLVPGWFELEDLGPFNIRGVADPVAVHALEGLGPIRTRLDLSRARGFSPFVGRAEEMAVLDAALDRARKGERQVVGIEAAPGLGKSRLCFEWLERVRREGRTRVHEVQCVPHRRMVPFAPLLRLLRTSFGVRERDDEETTRDKIAGKLVRLDPALADALPGLFEFLGVPDPARKAPPPDPAAREGMILEVTRRLLTRGGEPAVVLFEDLHWIDHASDGFLSELIESCAATPTLFLLNFRPEYRAPWMEADDYRALRLLPLQDAAADALLTDLLGRDPSLADLPARIRDHTRGNPFFIEEVVRALVDGESLTGERGAYRAARRIGSLGVPATIEALLAARIDRLPEREKRVLQDAAVLGRRFPGSALRFVVEEGEASLADALRALLEADFLREEPIHADAEYVFQHGLTHQVALRSQLAARRRAVHKRAALAREHIHAERADEHAALIAHHWESAGERKRAAGWHRRAAVWAGTNHAPESLEHWRRVRDLIGSHPADPSARELAAEARGQLIMAIGRMGGESDEADRLFSEAAALLDASDVRAAARIGLHYAHFAMTVGRAELAERTLDSVASRLPAARDPSLDAAYRYLLPLPRLLVRGSCHGVLDELEAGAAFAREHPGAGAEVLGFALEPLSLAWRGYTLALEGRLDEARRTFETAIALGAEGQLGASLQARNCALALADLLLAPATALEWGRQSLEVAAAMGFGRSLAEIGYGRACLMNGAPDAAIASFERGLAETLDTHSYAYQELPYRVALARAHLAKGDAASALACAETAVARAEDRGFYAADAFLARALARLAADAGASRAAARDAGEASRLFAESGASSRVAFAQRVQAECARREAAG
jgi:class 3 adenylate cyclase/tetratricopeptide (TPR) repeat protein